VFELNAHADTNINSNPAWCAVHTRHQHERTVATILRNKGFDVFLPTYQSVRRWKDRNKRLTLPLFPGYFFLRYEGNRRLQVLSTPGINGIVNAGDSPAVIPDHEIAGIRRMVEDSQNVEPHPFYDKGELVRVVAGPLAGLEGLIVRMKDGLRLILSITILGRSAAAEVDAWSIERTSPIRPVMNEFPHTRGSHSGSVVTF